MSLYSFLGSKLCRCVEREGDRHMEDCYIDPYLINHAVLPYWEPHLALYLFLSRWALPLSGHSLALSGPLDCLIMCRRLKLEDWPICRGYTWIYNFTKPTCFCFNLHDRLTRTYYLSSGCFPIINFYTGASYVDKSLIDGSVKGQYATKGISQ